MAYSEVKLWIELKSEKLNGYDFDRQRAIGNYIVDFYCKDVQLAIEIDGITHEEEKAKWKDERRIPHTLQLSSRSSLYEKQKSREIQRLLRDLTPMKADLSLSLYYQMLNHHSENVCQG